MKVNIHKDKYGVHITTSKSSSLNALTWEDLIILSAAITEWMLNNNPHITRKTPLIDSFQKEIETVILKYGNMNTELSLAQFLGTFDIIKYNFIKSQEMVTSQQNSMVEVECPVCFQYTNIPQSNLSLAFRCQFCGSLVTSDKDKSGPDLP